MRPLRLTLKGFRGIRDGLGLEELTLDLERLAGGVQLIAIAGANGSGKTTIMDSLTPYSVLASRAAAAGPGGFSYYDHVFLPESLKDLMWAHEGCTYRSQIVICLAGRRRTEAFLHTIDEGGVMSPVRLADGTVSDGRVETYNRCVEAICGSAETFFTSVFAAQGKRPLSAYRNAEIKTLLADLLGLDEIRVLGQKAGEVVRLLKGGLALMRQELSELEVDADRVRAELRTLEGAGDRVERCLRSRKEAQRSVDAAHDAHARLAVEREQARGVEARRSQLFAERQAALTLHAQSQDALHAQERRECERLALLDQRIAARVQRERARRSSLVQSRQHQLDILAAAKAVQRASGRLPLAERVLSRRVALTRVRRDRANDLVQCQSAARLAGQRLDSIEREAGKAALRAQELAHRFSLTGQVPCAGTELQGRCKLLGDAREARALIPDAKALLVRLACEKAVAQAELTALRERIHALADAPLALSDAEHCEAKSRDRVARLTTLAARLDACRNAQAMLAEVDRELAALGPLDTAAETAEEKLEREQVAASRRSIAEQLEHQAGRLSAALARVDSALAALPAPYDERRLAAATGALDHARAQLAATEQAHLAAMRDAQSFEALTKQAAALAEKAARLDSRQAHVGNELATWNLLTRCLSNDGIIALAIDDAGPSLSALANDLLLACYGPRFSVSIQTLLETGKGEPKESFDIVVHDAETGDSKSVAWMSGGEKNIIESCMTRAIALYIAQNSGRRYQTLFSDEADGALDADRKRMFMAMKREVLRLGGYEQEYFISQTPELTAMADAVIDLDAMAANAARVAV